MPLKVSLLWLPVLTPLLSCVQSLLWKPRVFLLHALLTPEECDELVAMARPELEASTVVDVATGQGMLSQVRTSTGMFIMKSTPTVDTLRQRVSHIVHLPEENQEAIQILRYKPGQFYKCAPSPPLHLSKSVITHASRTAH